MGYTRIPPFSGTGSITHVPTTASPVPVSDPVTTDYHPIPGASGIIIVPSDEPANKPVMTVTDLNQTTGSYIVGDSLQASVTVDDTDGNTTTGVSIFETGVLVGAATRLLDNTWRYVITAVTAGSKSYTAKRYYSGGNQDSDPTALTVLASMSPTQITSATCSAWWRVPESLQYGATPLATGTSPPVVTLSGTLTAQPYGLRVATGAGALGVATYSISLDNNTSVFQTGTTAATVNVGSGGSPPDTGIVVNFPVGTYSADNVYRAVVSQLNDKISSNTLINATSPQRPFPFYNQINGLTAIRYDGADDRHNCTTALANTVAGGTDRALTVALFLRVAGLPSSGGATIFRFGNTGSLAHGLELRIDSGTVEKWTAARRGDAGGTVTATSNIPATLGTHILIARFDGTNVNVRDNGVDVIGGSSDVTSTNISVGGAATLNNLSVAAQVSSGGTVNFAQIDLYEMAVFNAYISDAEVLQLERYY